MNITFLIGNGFDSNLGLATRYSDFIETYKGITTKDPIIGPFRKYVSDNKELWSAAEWEFGQYTAELGKGEGAKFSACQEDFCEELAKYLKKQMSRINYRRCENYVIKAFSRLNSLLEPFPDQERQSINNVYQRHISEGVNFRFICYNYTDTLDKCIEILLQHPDAMGSHKSAVGTHSHKLTMPFHVHGTTDKEMVFGVNDDSQIAKTDVFDCDNGDLYRDMLIKRQANNIYQENTDATGERLIKESHLIYIYGMSLGETDKLWWSRVCDWLSLSGERHVILYKRSLPEAGVLGTSREVAKRKIKKILVDYSKFEESKKGSLLSRIHVTDDNIFEGVRDLVKIGAHIQEFETVTARV